MRHLPNDITLSLCSPGADRPEFATRARHLAGHASSRLRLLGKLKDVRQLLATADGYLLTSRYEGQPIGALEAMEAGLPLMLAPFEGSSGLVRDHPMALRLEGDELQQAKAVDDLLTLYLSDRDRSRSTIKDFWAARYTPDRFATAARSLVFDKFLA